MSKEAIYDRVLDPWRLMWKNNEKEAYVFSVPVASAFAETPPNEEVAPGFYIIKTLEGELAATPGDWIIRGVKGEFYPCKADIFDATYELES